MDYNYDQTTKRRQKQIDERKKEVNSRHEKRI